MTITKRAFKAVGIALGTIGGGAGIGYLLSLASPWIGAVVVGMILLFIASLAIYASLKD